MTIKEEYMDIFTVTQGYYLAHCISADYTLGAGLVKEIDLVYDMKKKLNHFYPSRNGSVTHVGDALLVDNVFNLVNKIHYYDTATYENLQDALDDMAYQVNEKFIKKLAIPCLGCGKDHLSWEIVKEMVIETFKGTDIEILICNIGD